MKDHFQLQRLRAQFLFFYTLAIFLRLSSAQYTTDSSDTASQNEAGAAGPSSGSINLSTRDQIIIFTIVGVLVIFGGPSIITTIYSLSSGNVLSSGLTLSTAPYSHIGDLIPHCKETTMEGSSLDPPLRSTYDGSHKDAIDAQVSQVPEGPTSSATRSEKRYATKETLWG